MRTVALEAGVSAMTVSAALRGVGRLSPDMRRRVLEVAERLGYRRDPIIAAGLAQMRRKPESRIVAELAYLEVAPPGVGAPDHGTYEFTFQGARAFAEHLGYRLERIRAQPGRLSSARLRQILKARGIGGVVVNFFQLPDREEDLRFPYDLSNFMVVSVASRLPGTLHPFVTADHFADLALAVKTLDRLGYRRIGLACNPRLDLLLEHRFTHAFLGYQTKLPAARRVPIFPDWTQGSHAAQRAALLAWIKRQRPDVVLGWLDPESLAEIGQRVPEDLGVAMLDLWPRHAGVSGVDQNHRAIGAAAVRLLASHLQQPDSAEFGTRTQTAVLVEGHWVQGKTSPGPR